MFKTEFENLRRTCPLIHNITNYVTVNDCANMVLACGASPIMADDAAEVEDITTICGGLNINIGTLNSRPITSMLLAGKKANQLGHPVVLDPVGAGASRLRTDTAFRLLRDVKFTVIRGNISDYGIGFAIASAFAEQGAKICFNDINQELVDKGMAAYAEKGIKAHGYVCDVTDEPAVQAMVATIEKEVGTIDILVNNAGIIRRVPMHEMEAADFRRVIDIDLNAPFIVSKAVLPAMMKKGHGKIINICSMMSELGRETVSAYAAAKGGLKMLTRNICSEYGEYNIQCNGIGPGYIATPQTAPLREKQPDGSRHPFDSFICAKTPAGRWLDPEELTGPAVFLASEASNAVNGHVLYVDGGILAYIGKQPK